MADYWIKWYIEIIDDPKMATLPDRLWRRFSELCLLAGRLCNDKSGLLPDTRQLAWALRMSSDELQTDLVQLAATGIIESVSGGWLIPNFRKRQQAATPTERVHQHRERKQKQQYYDNETDSKRNVTQINRAETEHSRDRAKNTPPVSPDLLKSNSRVTQKLVGVAESETDQFETIFQNEKSKRTKCKIDPANLKNRLCQNETTIPETPSETPSETLDNLPQKKSEPGIDYYPIAKALSDVTGIDFDKNKSRLFGEAKHYKLEDVAQILSDYAPGCGWYTHDWRGKKGQAPSLAQVRESWGKLIGSGRKPRTPETVLITLPDGTTTEART